MHKPLSFYVVDIEGHRGDCPGDDQNREGQRIESYRFGCRPGLLFPVDPVVRTALVPVRQIQAYYCDDQSAGDTQIIDTDAEQSKPLTADFSKRSAKKQAVKRCFCADFSLIRSSHILGCGQEHGQIGCRIHDRKQSAEEFGGKGGLHGGYLVSARIGQKPVPFINNMNEAA